MSLLTPRNNAPASVKGRSDAEVLAILDGGALPTLSGIRVTDDSALRQATNWACVRILSEAIGSLPVYLQRLEGTSWVDVQDHPVAELLREPNDWQSTHEFMSFLVTWFELRGNAYALKASAGPGMPARMLLPVPSPDVTPRQDDDWTVSYKVARMGEKTPAQIMHLRNFSKDGFQGLSTVAYHRETIGLALQAEAHGASVFRNGINPGKVITTAKKISEEREKEIERKLDAEFAGAHNAGKTIVLGNGGDIKTIGMTLSDAQYIDSRRMQKQEIAMLYGVPMFLLNDTEKSTTWGTGLEQISKAFVRYTLNPRLSRISACLHRNLLKSAEQREYRFVFDTDSFTLGDFKERMDGYRSGIEAGVINPNEAREMEGRSPRQGGDEYRQPANIDTEGGGEDEA